MSKKIIDYSGQKIEKRKISDLRAFELNPRKGEGSVDYVQKSIKKTGYHGLIQINESNVVINGHNRLKALKQIAKTEGADIEINVEVIDENEIGELIVLQKRLYDNKASEYSKWDAEILDAYLLKMADLDPSLDLEGMDFKIENYELNLEDVDLDPAKKEKDEKKGDHTCPKCGFIF